MKAKKFLSDLFRPFRNWRRQKFFIRKYGICNKDVVIFSNNCLAGITYHDANKQFLSPTINLSIGENFLTFVKNFSYYSKSELTEIQSSMNCPMGIIKGKAPLPDITVKFTHYETFKDAKEKWIERCKRINKKYPIFLIYTSEILKKSDIQSLEEIDCKKAICITKEISDIGIYSSKIKVVKVPEKCRFDGGTSYKHLFSRKRFFDDYVNLYELIYVQN